MACCRRPGIRPWIARRPNSLKSELRRILGFIRRKVEEQRSHAEYLQSASAASAAPHRERRVD